MPKKSINQNLFATNSAIEFVAFPQTKTTLSKSSSLNDKVLAVQTSRRSLIEKNVDTNSPFQGFNLGLHVGDAPELVNQNRHYLESLLPEQAKIQWLEQVHGNEVAHVTQVSQQPITADAAITHNKGICLAVMTADCLPILLTAQQGGEVAAIHGGWRPLAANIVANTVSKMNTPTAELLAWLGPCIGKTVFEVGDEVRKTFVGQSPIFSKAFTAKGNSKFLADLSMIAQIQLRQLGVTQIKVESECTFLNSDKYYSYRKNATTGRMASLICLL